MQSIRFHEHGDIDVLRIDDVKIPTPGPNEVLIHTRAASVNPIDVKLCRGDVWRVDFPKTIGTDFAGDVEAVGDAVSDYQVGDRVFGTGLDAGTFQQGALAEYIAVPASLIAPLPSTTSYEVGAATALVGATAWEAIVEAGAIETSDTCLIYGASGGLGHVAVQLASSAGADVIAITSPGTEERVRDLGATDTLQYTDDHLTEQLKEYSGTCDIVLDPFADEYLATDIDVAAPRGRVVIVSGGTSDAFDTATSRRKNLTLHTISMSNVPRPWFPRSYSYYLEKVRTLLASELISAHVDDVYEFENAVSAYEDLIDTRVFGKHVVRFDDNPG